MVYYIKEMVNLQCAFSNLFDTLVYLFSNTQCSGGRSYIHTHPFLLYNAISRRPSPLTLNVSNGISYLVYVSCFSIDSKSRNVAADNVQLRLVPRY